VRERNQHIFAAKPFKVVVRGHYAVLRPVSLLSARLIAVSVVSARLKPAIAELLDDHAPNRVSFRLRALIAVADDDKAYNSRGAVVLVAPTFGQ